MDAPRTIRVRVDPANPGQFFACCGLLELADRLWDGAEGWFEDGLFRVQIVNGEDDRDTVLERLVSALTRVELLTTDPDDETASPLWLGEPFNCRLDWWTDRRSGGERLKVWAGRMSSVRIAKAMQRALAGTIHNETMFDHGQVVYDADEPTKKVEPFYFDARRGSSARSLDIGFAPDSFGMTTVAYPTVELLCLIGLQRVRPRPVTVRKRAFEYRPWGFPLRPIGAACAACGELSADTEPAYVFEVRFRTDQRKHKAFISATHIVRR